MDKQHRIQIAEEIIAQLGGKPFAVMTGARQFTALESGLSFRIPWGIANHRINHVSVVLEPDDTYTVTFSRIRGMKVTEVTMVEDVYCENLAEIFRDITGLETRMPRIFNLKPNET